MDDPNISPHLDRLSELPDSLILMILPLLDDMEDVVRTTLLSKRWKDLWTTVPCLRFQFRMDTSVFKFTKFVYAALSHWKGAKVLKFNLSTLWDQLYNRDVDLWLLFAIEKQVEELYFDLGGLRRDLRGWNSKYFVLQRLFSCSSIAKLSLFYCNLEIDENVQWNRLKSLTIKGCKSLSGDAMAKIMSGSSKLEELVLYFEEIGEDLNIRSASLKILQIGFRYCSCGAKAVLGIWAPNLLTLEISGFLCFDCLLDVPSLSSAVLDCRKHVDIKTLPSEMLTRMFRSICHVEKVTLSDWCIEPFSNAKFAKLCACVAYEMVDVLHMFPQITTLIVEFEKEHPREYHYIKTSFPNPSLLQLKKVDIIWPIQNELIIPAIEVVLQNAHLLDKLVFRPFMSTVERMIFSMPRSSPTAEVIIIVIDSSKICFSSFGHA